MIFADDWHGNEDAGDLEASQAAGHAEALGEEHAAGEHAIGHGNGCRHARFDVRMFQDCDLLSNSNGSSFINVDFPDSASRFGGGNSFGGNGKWQASNFRCARSVTY